MSKRALEEPVLIVKKEEEEEEEEEWGTIHDEEEEEEQQEEEEEPFLRVSPPPRHRKRLHLHKRVKAITALESLDRVLTTAHEDAWEEEEQPAASPRTLSWQEEARLDAVPRGCYRPGTDGLEVCELIKLVWQENQTKINDTLTRQEIEENEEEYWNTAQMLMGAFKEERLYVQRYETNNKTWRNAQFKSVMRDTGIIIQRAETLVPAFCVVKKPEAVHNGSKSAPKTAKLEIEMLWVHNALKGTGVARLFRERYGGGGGSGTEANGRSAVLNTILSAQRF